MKVIKISTGEEVDCIFTDLGDVKDWGEFYTSQLEVDGKKYISKVQHSIAKLNGDIQRFRLSQDLANFQKHGFKIIL